MTRISLFFFICEFLIFIISSADTLSPPIFNGYQIVSLLPSTESRFSFEAEAWNSSGLLRSTKYSFCVDVWILGGPNALQNGGYFVNKFDDLPAHNIIYYSIRFMLIGSWSSTDIISLFFGSKKINIGSINLLSSEFNSYTCDGTTRNALYLYTISGKLLHTDSSLTLKIVSDLTAAPTQANFGVRAIFLSFTNKTASDTESYCFSNNFAIITQAVPNKCPCTLGTYQNPSNPAQCLDCDTSCWSCFGPSSSECSRCQARYSFVGTECILCDTSCGQCSGPDSDQCVTCASGLWLYWDGTCRSTCTSPMTSQLVYDDLQICNLPCPEGQFMLWNGTCVDYCDEPLKVVDNSTGVFCDRPCDDGKFFFEDSCIDSCDGYYMESVELDVDVCIWKCISDEYMLWNLTCRESCEDPFVKVDNSTGVFCDKPCLDGEFFYANGTCIDSCELPFETSVVLDIDMCLWKCDEGQFMRWDWSCWEICEDPLVEVTNSTGNFCFKPCEDGEFLYSNGSCIELCVFPFEQRMTQDVVDSCLFKCGSDEFLYTNDESCVSSCEFPFLSRDGEGVEGKFCYSPCESDEYILADRSCSVNCSTPHYYSEKIDAYTQLCFESETETENEDYDEIRTIVKVIKTEGQISYGLMLALSIGKMGSSSSLCLASLAKMLEYIKYMKIAYYQRLELMFQLQGSSELSLSFDVPLSEGIQKHFPDHELPENFEEYELASSFFLNYWETLGTLLVIIAGTLVLSLLSLITKGKVYHHAFLWLKIVFKWNFLLMIFCSNLESVVFFTSLEMRTLNVDSFAAFLSVFLCIIANIFAVVVLGRIAFILKDIRKLKYRQVRDVSMVTPNVNPHLKWKSYQVLFLHCHEEKPIQQGFFIIFLVRVYLFHLTIGYIFPDPLAQSVIITALSLLMLAYLIIQRPLEEKGDLIKMVINEFIVLVVNFSALVLAALDQDENQTEGNTEILSFIIIMANLVFNTLAMVFLGIEGFIGVVKISKEIKAHKLKGITSLLEIFMIMFAGEAMAMEEEYLSPDIEATTTTLEKTPAKQKPQLTELEIPQNNDEKTVNATTAELLKFRSPQSPSSPRSARSLVDEEEEGRLSVIGKGRGSVIKQGRKSSETVFKFDSSSLKELEGSKKKASVSVKSESASMVLLSPPNLMDEKERSLKCESESEPKATPLKMDTTSENLKLLFKNWPEGDIMNLDD